MAVPPKSRVSWDSPEKTALYKWFDDELQDFPSKDALEEQLGAWHADHTLKESLDYPRVRKKLVAHAKELALARINAVFARGDGFSWDDATAAKKTAQARLYKCPVRVAGGLFKQAKLRPVPVAPEEREQEQGQGQEQEQEPQQAPEQESEQEPEQEQEQEQEQAPPPRPCRCCKRCGATEYTDAENSWKRGMRCGVQTPRPDFSLAGGRTGYAQDCAHCRSLKARRPSERRHRQTPTAVIGLGEGMLKLAWAEFGARAAALGAAGKQQERIQVLQSACDRLRSLSGGACGAREPREVGRLFRQISNSARLNEHKRRRPNSKSPPLWRAGSQYGGGGGLVPLTFTRRPEEGDKHPLRPARYGAKQARRMAKKAAAPGVPGSCVTWVTLTLLPYLDGCEVWNGYACSCVTALHFCRHAWSRFRVGCPFGPRCFRCQHELSQRTAGRHRRRRDQAGDYAAPVRAL